MTDAVGCFLNLAPLLWLVKSEESPLKWLLVPCVCIFWLLVVPLLVLVLVLDECWC